MTIWFRVATMPIIADEHEAELEESKQGAQHTGKSKMLRVGTKHGLAVFRLPRRKGLVNLTIFDHI